MQHLPPVMSPAYVAMDDLCDELSRLADAISDVSDWPSQSLDLCGQRGVYRWFLPEDQGGYGWSASDQIRGYLRLAQADLTTTFVITQYMGAVRRIAASGNTAVTGEWLESLASGKQFSTVGISHLTTSRRHLKRPVLRAEESTDGYILDGISPWVTGAPHADLYVVGATLPNSEQVLLAVPSTLPGIKAGPGHELVALSASCTDQVGFDRVHVNRTMLLNGPNENVLTSATGIRTGGLQTSTLAVGLAQAAVNFLSSEAANRTDIMDAATELRQEVDALAQRLITVSDGDTDCDASQIRTASNRLALRSTQAALTAAKGAGFVKGHPVGRWCREALFFLVWSCPQPIAQAHLCELAFDNHS
ncbi:MAG: isovaleryl-CoA dehydrogenase [Planctomycetaceae bacterium TMED240]|nr:isovaleryl-CoA dehydrogenase [Rhodopirellula sp.]OUX06421.1 MAG: isovaleryl-CoA dehydrogenase [Planctomycetaceae bacterium TMED240]